MNNRCGWSGGCVEDCDPLASKPLGSLSCLSFSFKVNLIVTLVGVESRCIQSNSLGILQSLKELLCGNLLDNRTEDSHFGLNSCIVLFGIIEELWSSEYIEEQYNRYSKGQILLTHIFKTPTR